MKRFLFVILGSVTLTQTITANVEPSASVDAFDGGTQSTIPMLETVLDDGTRFVFPESV